MTTGQQFFVAATGTDTGKTFVTSYLCQKLRANQKTVKALKPVASGWVKNDHSNDVAQLLKAQGLEYSDQNIEKIAPYRYEAALSPDIAAQKEGRNVPFELLSAFCETEIINQEQDILFIEGVGGIMSPLAKGKTNLDLVEKLNIPVILVIGNYLGSVSHTLTAISAMHQRDIKIFCLILNENQWDDVTAEDMIAILQDYLTLPIILLPKMQNVKEENQLMEIVNKIVKRGMNE